MMKSKQLSLQEQVDIIFAMAPVWKALGEAFAKLAEKGISWETKFNAASGEFNIRFYPEQRKDC